jgi:hypothetical protein
LAENGKSNGHNGRAEVLPPDQENEQKVLDEPFPLEERLEMPVEPLTAYPCKKGCKANGKIVLMMGDMFVFWIVEAT